MNKDLNRHKHSSVVVWIVVFLAIATVALTALGKLSPEFNFALGLFLGYAGNHTFQNYRTAPKDEKSE